MEKPIKDYSIRVEASIKNIKLLKKHFTKTKVLPKLTDYYLKPANKDLNAFHPNEVCIRLRVNLFSHEAFLHKITIKKTALGYTDNKDLLGLGSEKSLKGLAKKLGYNIWGKVSFYSTEYTYVTDNGDTIFALLQNIKPLGDYIKIEAPNKKALAVVNKLLFIDGKKAINKNSAVLLAEKLRFI